MTTKDTLKEPIRTLSEWKSTLFPNLPDEEQYTEKTPADIAVKLANRAVKSLPNNPIKPTQ